jgi:hypothetical protein
MVKIKTSGLGLGYELPPHGGIEGEHRAGRVLGVTDGDHVRQVVGDLHAVAAVT